MHSLKRKTSNFEPRTLNFELRTLNSELRTPLSIRFPNAELIHCNDHFTDIG